MGSGWSSAGRWLGGLSRAVRVPVRVLWRDSGSGHAGTPPRRPRGHGGAGAVRPGQRGEVRPERPEHGDRVGEPQGAPQRVGEMIDVEQGLSGRIRAVEPQAQGPLGIPFGVLGDPVKIQSLLLPVLAAVALDPHVQRQDMERGAVGRRRGRPLGEIDRLREGAAGFARVYELEHPVVGLAVARIAPVGFRQQAPRTGKEHRPRRMQPVLLQPLLLVQLGQGQQAHPWHRVGRGGAGGGAAGLPGFLPQFLRPVMSFTVGAYRPLHDDPCVHHDSCDAPGLLGPPGLHRVGSRGDRSEHLGALGPQRPVRSALQQIAHGDPATGAQVL